MNKILNQCFIFIHELFIRPLHHMTIASQSSHISTLAYLWLIWIYMISAICGIFIPYCTIYSAYLGIYVYEY